MLCGNSILKGFAVFSGLNAGDKLGVLTFPAIVFIVIITGRKTPDFENISIL
jgi:hypothetical protein